MGEIVDFTFERGHRAGRERGSGQGPAQVVLYTGIRYERAEEPPPAPQNPPKRRKRKKKQS